MMLDAEFSFAVIYRWKLTPGLEPGFVEAWQSVARTLEEQFGAHGVCLHAAEDSTWVACAMWPNRKAWENARLESPDGFAAMRNMQHAIERRFEPILMKPIASARDLLDRSTRTA